jgi:hypothetical protein
MRLLALPALTRLRVKALCHLRPDGTQVLPVMKEEII